MKILCVICQDLLIPSDDIFFTRCGHVFHHHCLLQWLERSKTCPQCRDKVTEDKVHKAHFTFSNTEIENNVVNLSLQGRIDSLKFEVLLNEKNIKYYTSKNAILAKQNTGLRQEVRKVESEINQKNSTIYALKEQIKYLKRNVENIKEKYRDYEVLKKKLSEKKSDVKHFQDILQTLSTGTLEDIQEMMRKITNHNILPNYSSLIKTVLLKQIKKIKNQSEGQRLIVLHRNKLLTITPKRTPDQDSVIQSSSRRNPNEKSPISTQAVNISVQEIEDQNNSSSPEVEIITEVNQTNSMHNAPFGECPTVTKKAKLCL